MEKSLEQCVADAEMGRQLWLSYKLDRFAFCLLLIEEDEAENRLFLELFREKLLQTGKAGVVLHADADFSLPENIQGICFKQRELEQIMKLYEMYEFTDKLLIASFKRPCGRRIHQLIGYRGLSAREVAAAVIFKMREAEQHED